MRLHTPSRIVAMVSKPASLAQAYTSALPLVPVSPTQPTTWRAESSLREGGSAGGEGCDQSSLTRLDTNLCPSLLKNLFTCWAMVRELFWFTTKRSLELCSLVFLCGVLCISIEERRTVKWCSSSGFCGFLQTFLYSFYNFLPYLSSALFF